MSIRSFASSRCLFSCLAAWFAMAVCSVASVHAGHLNFRNNVGGVSIDTDGVLREPDTASRKLLLEALRKEITKASAELSQPVGMRMVSLRGLEAACRQAMENNLGSLPQEVRFLAGLQRIQYVIVVPAQNDVILAGPGEGWRVDENAQVVGITTGRPVLQLDDLLIALRQVEAARGVGISCSIDPTPEGRQRYETLTRQLRGDPRSHEAELKRAMGPQTVTITGVPTNSHFARVLAAADFRMKRYGMGVEPAPVKGLPSYLEMTKNRSSSSADLQPRWWLTTEYEPIARSEDGLVWELRGQGVKCLSDVDLIEGGVAKASGRKDSAAEKWAGLFTEKFDELAAKDHVFHELRNLMDLSVIAALIQKENLLAAANCQIPLLAQGSHELSFQKWNAPKSVDTHCTFIKTRGGWTFAASGGVQIESWQVADKTAPMLDGKQIHDKAVAAAGKSWWWN